MVYIDDAIFYTNNGRVAYAHMTADSIPELHAFAATINVKRCWWHSGSKYPHYDVNATKRLLAIDQGAKCVSSTKLVEIARALHASNEPK